MHIAPIKLYGHKPFPNDTHTLIKLIKLMIKHEYNSKCPLKTVPVAFVD